MTMTKKKRQSLKKKLVNMLKLSKYMVYIIYDYVNYSHENLLKIYNQNCQNKVPVIHSPLFEKCIRAIQMGYAGIGFKEDEIQKNDIKSFLQIHNNFYLGSYQRHSYIMINGSEKNGIWINALLV